MTKKEWLLVALTLVLLAVYAVYFTDWFKKETIHISHTVRPTRQAQRMSAETGVMISFGFDHPLRLKEVSVVPLAEWETNRLVLPLWHLVSDSNSAPVGSFVYGGHIRGMKAAEFSGRLQPLTNHVVYRLFVTAGKVTGEHDFQIGPPVAPATK